MGRERRAEDAKVRVILELAEYVQHMGGIFADVLVADIAEAGTYAAWLGLDGLFIVHEAGVDIITAQLRGQVAEERTHIAAAIFHHLHGERCAEAGQRRRFRSSLFCRVRWWR